MSERDSLLANSSSSSSSSSSSLSFAPSSPISSSTTTASTTASSTMTTSSTTTASILSSPSSSHSPSPSNPTPILNHFARMLLGKRLQSIMLAVYLCIAILLSSANSITWKRTLNSFRSTDGSGRNLEFFVTQWTVFLYVVLAALIMLYRMWFTNLIQGPQHRSWPPQMRFVYMGALDAGAGVAGAIGGAFVSGQLQTLLNQSSIPFTMFMSYSFLRHRYSWIQYVGAALILAGALFAAYPSAMGGDLDEGTTWYGLLILVFSFVPGSFSNVYKEANLKEELDVFYLTTLVSWWQVVIGFAFAPILSLPGFGGIAMSEIPQNFQDGWDCFMGRDVRGYAGCSATPGPWYMLLIYVIVNFVYNTLLLLITKHGSAVLLVIACALSLPVTNLIFTCDFIMGDDSEELDQWTMLGLVSVVVGFLLYSFSPDPSTGEIQIALGPSGQMAFITESAPSVAELGDDDTMLKRQLRRLRRGRSFDAADSPNVINARKQNQKRALLLHEQQQQLQQQQQPQKSTIYTPLLLNRNTDNV